MIEIGMNHRTVRTVEPAYTAATLKSGLLEVLATPIMIAWMENAAWSASSPSWRRASARLAPW